MDPCLQLVSTNAVMENSSHVEHTSTADQIVSSLLHDAVIILVFEVTLEDKA